MNYKNVQSELVVHLRGKRTQQRLADKLGWDHNKVYLIESCKSQLDWNDFVRLCEVSKIDSKILLKKAFGFTGDIHKPYQLVKHFFGKKPHAEIAENMQVSKSTISRWLSGLKTPNFAQMLKIIDTYTIEYFLFMTLLTGDTILPSLETEIQKENAYLSLYDKYPWLSLVLASLDTKSYVKNPTSLHLSQKLKIPVESINQCLNELASQNLIQWTKEGWNSCIHRIRMRTPSKTKHKVARCMLKRAHDSVESGYDLPQMKFSWKIFNINQKHFDKIYQKYMEFFNEMGRLIEEDQTDADKVYVFTSTLLDVESMAGVDSADRNT